MKARTENGKGSLGEELGLTRRDLLRRGAVVGGTLLWVAPAIQSIAPNAYAQQQVGSFKACCQCSGAGSVSGSGTGNGNGGGGGTQSQPAGCTVDVITYDECFARCGGAAGVAHYGVGNYACVDGTCVPLDDQVTDTTGSGGGPTGDTGPGNTTGPGNGG
jgi:hypothetical protein